MTSAPIAPSTLPSFALVITRIGLTSFGGGLSAWMLRAVVHERRWVTEAEFLTGLSLSQVFPGVNVLNLAIWLGYKLHGGRGAVVGALAMLVPPGLLLLAFAAAVNDISRYPGVRVAMDGVAAAAIGLGATMGIRAARRSAGHLIPVAIMAVTFASVGLMRLPLVPVLSVLAPLSIGLAFWQDRDAH